MSAKIIDGKAVAADIKNKVKENAVAYVKIRGRMPCLAVVLVGEDPASQVYVRNKITACEQCGIKSLSYTLPEKTTTEELIKLIDELAVNREVDGILVQLPLPKGIDENAVLERIPAKKDVDGFHAQNLGNLLIGGKCTVACTPLGCMELIKSTGIEIEGKHAVVVGRSNIVGKPMALLLLNENATVTVAHSRTKNLAEITSAADILVVAVGKKEFIRGNMIKKGAVVIDVGINRCDGKLYGDVNFDEAKEVASFITPVPGGVGPMTITMLLYNTITAAERSV